MHVAARESGRKTRGMTSDRAHKDADDEECGNKGADARPALPCRRQMG